VDPQTYERAAAQIAAALESLGLKVRVKESGATSVFEIDGAELQVLVEPRAVMRPSEVPSLRRPPGGAAGVVVADRVSETARKWLRTQRWGWLDRRGHLRFWWPEGGVRIDSDLPGGVVHAPDRSATNPFSPTGLRIAVELLMNPTRPLAVRDAASRIGASAGHVSLVVATLRDLGLVDRARRPISPDLFWALAERWHPTAIPLRSLPRRNAGDLELALSNWVLGGDAAAARWGAPIVISERYPPDLYVPTIDVFRLATHRFGEAAVE